MGEKRTARKGDVEGRNPSYLGKCSSIKIGGCRPTQLSREKEDKIKTLRKEKQNHKEGQRKLGCMRRYVSFKVNPLPAARESLLAGFAQKKKQERNPIRKSL